MAEIWAKSSKDTQGNPIFLSIHTNDILEAFEKIKSHISNDYLHELIRIAIICHDFGKALPAFQIKKLGNKDYEPFDLYYDIDHSLASVLWINQKSIQEKIEKLGLHEDTESYIRFIVSAVAYHHWREQFIPLLRTGNLNFQKLCEKLLNDSLFLQAITSNLQKQLKQVANSDSFIEFNKQMAEGLLEGVPFIEYATPPYQLYWLPKRITESEKKLKDWIIISGILMRCDHFASYCEESGEQIEKIEEQSVSFDTIKSVVKERISKKLNKKDVDIWQLREIDIQKENNVILVAPTGYGKTEFAFLWGGSQKFFYTLPLRSAVNQIFERARDIFEQNETNEKVGLLHGDADVYLLGDGGETENLKLYDMARQLSYPAIISTGDQFFPYALRPPGFEKIYASFISSRLIIDEVQAYNPKAGAIIVKFVLDIIRMGGKFLLMTATLPSFIFNEIEKGLKETDESFTLIDIYEKEKDTLSKIKKHRVQFLLISTTKQDEKINFELKDEYIEKIIAKAKEGKRVLVVLNTVKQAIDVYEKLKTKIEQTENSLKNKLWLLHSRFTLHERSEIEKLICGNVEAGVIGEFQNPKTSSETQGKILVSTQVVEASLDIDADILFTEIAPLDALVQRMGRVLRRIKDKYEHNREPNIYILVFENGFESGNGKVYERELLGISLKLFSKLLEGEFDSKRAAEDIKKWYNEKSWSDLKIINFEESKINTKKKKGEFIVSCPSEPILLSELDKKQLVDCLYSSLDTQGNYLNEFYKTIDILNAGYMSDRKEEAHRIFREIFSISIIPSNLEDSFKEEVLDFLNQYEEKKRLYSLFKKQVLSKYVVQVPIQGNRLPASGKKLELWIKEQREFDQDRKNQQRLIRWTKNIYFADYEYEEKIGIMINKKSGSYDSVFL